MNPFIGIGTGRCGSTSLGHLIAACDTPTIHDKKGYLLSWNHTRRDRLALKRILLYLQPGRGAISHSYLTHAEYLRERIPNLGIICLHRDKQEFIRSALRRRQFKSGPRYGIPFTSSWKHQTRRFFPQYDTETAVKAFSIYHDEYEARARTLDGVYHMKTEDLNDDLKLGRLFNWLGIAPERQVLLSKRRWNPS